MNTLNEKLKEAQKEFTEAKKEYRGYDKPALPEIIAFNKAYRETGEYPYNASIKKYILEREKIAPELLDYLDTEIYLSQQAIKDEKEITKDGIMLGEGWHKIPTPNEIFDYRGRAMVCATKDLDWTTSKIETEGKIIDGAKSPFFIPKGRRTRGYYFQMLNGYWKPLNS